MDKHSEIKIRNCVPEDFSKVVEIESASFDDPYPAWLFVELLEQNPNGFRVAILNDKIVGYCVTSTDRSKKAAILNSLAVVPRWRRQEIGKALVKDAISYAQNNLPRVRKIILQVALENRPAQSLYSNLGFVKSFTIKDYYGKNKDGIQMELVLLT